MLPEIVAIVGPTASGKTAVSLRIAERLGQEIISCDSMQVYRELSIGVAKPGREILQRWPHHCLDCASIHERYDLNRFVAEARQVLERLQRQGRGAILVGGSGLYARGLLASFDLQPSDKKIFADLCEIASRPSGVNQLRGELAAADQAESLPRTVYENPRRLIRAVEILRLTGRPPRAAGTDSVASPVDRRRAAMYVLLPPADELRSRIAERTGQMLAAGWIDEVRLLLEQGLANTPTAYQALGYRTIADFLCLRSPTAADRQALAERLATQTWQYARRQMTWFRHQHPGAWLLTLRHGCTPEMIADAVIADLATSTSC